VVLLLTGVSTATAKYSGGSGTAQDPYRIATAADLIALGETPADYYEHFILTADIDLDPNLPGRKVFDKAVIASDNDPGKYGFQGLPFRGVFDGNGHTISHLTMKGKDYLGLFGQLDWKASVSNLGLEAVEVSGADRVGGLVGYNSWSGSITASYSTGTVSGTGETSSVGGLVGENRGSITTSYSTGAVSGRVYVGGLVGSNGGSITMSYSSGSVSGTGWWRGFVGGLVGENWGSIATSYSTGSVSGSQSVGGLVGSNSGSIAACYSTGSVSGYSSNVGGLVGYGSPGGVSACVWDTETSGHSGSVGGVGLTTSEMMAPEILGLNGFANDPKWVLEAGRDYPRLAWQSTPGNMIPEPDVDWLDGQGTAEVPYRIDTADQLILLGKASILWDRHFVLGADIDLDPALPGRSVLGQALIAVFSGVFDGAGHAISHLTIQGGGYLGLFGRLASCAEVKNVGLADVKIVGSGRYVGGLVGMVQESGRGTGEVAKITDCHSTGLVRGYWSVGGLLGSNNGAVTRCYSTSAVTGMGDEVGGLVGSNGYHRNITNCYSSGSVSGAAAVGGLVGWSRGSIATSYSSGAVSGTRSVGGLVGCNGFPTPLDEFVGSGSVIQCYSSGMVCGGEAVGGLVGSGWDGNVGHSFWDTDTSGQAGSAGGAGRTTIEMQTASTFLDAGWDFVGETANGTKDIWWILDGDYYPLLWNLTPLHAWSPYPENGGVDINPGDTLAWVLGRAAMGHDVYFGEDPNAVRTATMESVGIYRGRQKVGSPAYDPGVLDWGKTYYWRIDEVNETDPDSPWKGNVWSFTTIDYILLLVVDDFESYTDDGKAGEAIFQTWLDGFGYPGDPNYPGNGTGSIVGYMNPPFAEQWIVHSGRQSMPMDYNNVNEPWYSEAERVWETPQDWMSYDADTLTLYFRGELGNSPEPLYVAIEDNSGRIAVVVHPDANAVLATQWQKWHIALAEVQAAGVDVAAVKKMVIGVGDRNNPQPSGTGRIYIDDIRLTKRMP
jgi:hypothetical protein